MEIKVNNESNKNNSLREVQEWCRGHRGKFPLWILIYRTCAMLYTMSSTISLNTKVSLKESFFIIPKAASREIPSQGGTKQFGCPGPSQNGRGVFGAAVYTRTPEIKATFLPPSLPPTPGGRNSIVFNRL